MTREDFNRWLGLYIQVFPDVNTWLVSFENAKAGDPNTDVILDVWGKTLAEVEYADAIAATERMSKDLSLRPHTPQDTAAFVLTVATNERSKRLARERDATYDQVLLPGTETRPEDFYGHLDWAFTKNGRPRRLLCFKCKDQGQLRVFWERDGKKRDGVAACVCERGAEEAIRMAGYIGPQYREGTPGVEAFDMWHNPFNGSKPEVPA